MVVVLCALSASAKKPPPAPPPLEEVAGQLVGGALTSDVAWDGLEHLTTQIGNRIVGSPELDQAIAWGADELRRQGLVDVHTEPVTLPSWTRGTLSVTVTAPRERAIQGLSLGDSVGTGPEGLDASVVVVSTFDELDALPDEQVKGHVVVWDAPFTDYGETVAYRFAGASAASRRGAVASLVRSIGPSSLYTAHTGAQRYDDDVTPIPAVAIPLEDAAWLHRLQDQGKTARIRIASTASPAGDVQSANVVGDVRGRSLPDEVVVLGCHIDSWDVGEGAQDDGAGCVQAIGAAALIAKQPVPPRRTVRVVLYTGEESGGHGGDAYAEAHAGEPHFAAIESDTGSGRPLGFHVDVRPPGDAEHESEPDPARIAKAVAAVQPAARALAVVGATVLEQGYAGTDIHPLIDRGVPGFGLTHDTTGYWPIHHTSGRHARQGRPCRARRRSGGDGGAGVDARGARRPAAARGHGGGPGGARRQGPRPLTILPPHPRECATGCAHCSAEGACDVLGGRSPQRVGSGCGSSAARARRAMASPVTTRRPTTQPTTPRRARPTIPRPPPSSPPPAKQAPAPSRR
ncbi:MAG: M20/M25/M40 family metallo-hydrolase [Myxococcota bacterium]